MNNTFTVQNFDMFSKPVIDSCLGFDCITMTNCISQCEQFLHTENKYWLWLFLTIVLAIIIHNDKRVTDKYKAMLLDYIITVSFIVIVYELVYLQWV